MVRKKMMVKNHKRDDWELIMQKLGGLRPLKVLSTQNRFKNFYQYYYPVNDDDDSL